MASFADRIKRFSYLTVCLAAICWTSFAQAARNYEPHNGYVDDTDGEREAHYSEIIPIHPPKDGPTLQDRIFNDKLSGEFRDRYEQKFGRTEVERVYNSPNRTSYYDDFYGVKGTPQDIDGERRRFGEYMLRRLGEYHVENWAKSDSKARTVWQAKERVSDVKLTTGKFKFNVKYNLSGNILDLTAANPEWVNARIRMESIVGSGDRETIVTLTRDITPTIRIESDYKVVDGIARYVLRKQFSPVLAGSLSHSTFTKSTGVSVRESTYLTGLSFIF